jgi:hypothetical protein
MSKLSFKLDQLFMLLVPDLAAGVDADVAATFKFPVEVNFVQKFLSIKSKFVSVMKAPLCTDPPP